MQKTQILLVVSDSSSTSTIKTILELEKWIEVVGITENQKEALELAERFSPDVVVIDFDLQEEGFKTGELIMKSRPSTKIIALSLYDFIGNVKVKSITQEESKIASSFEWISKNSSPVALIDSIAGTKISKKHN